MRKILFAFLALAVLLLACGGGTLALVIGRDIYLGLKAESNVQSGNHETTQLQITTPTSVPTTPTEVVSSIDLNLRTEGDVDLNHDDGNFGMGTVMKLTRDDVSKDPTLFLIVPGYSLDVEYEGKMHFITDRYDGDANINDAVQFAEGLYPDVETKVFVGPASFTPEGWTHSDEAESWWSLRDWKYSEKPIEPKGLTASEGIFVSDFQSNRDLVAGKNEVIYGQFWTTVSPGYVVHVQVRQGETLSVPANWQGTYWVWTGDFKKGELDLQRRMIQATFQEVVDRDDIQGVKLLVKGVLPEGIDPMILTFNFDNAPVTWLVEADDAWIK